MSAEPSIQHWLVPVVRAAGLDEDGALEVASDHPVAGAWDLVAIATGVSGARLAELVAAHYGLAVADLGAADAHASRLVPAPVARKLMVLPLRCTNRTLAVATADPVSLETELELSRLADRVVTFEVAPPSALAEQIERTYPPDAEVRHELPPLQADAVDGPRILVVDDDPGMRVLLRTTLELDGFRVAEAEDGPQALELVFGDEPFDLVTLDLRMYEMHGLEVLRKIRSRLSTATLPVVVATAMDDPDIEMELFAAGADDFVVKPVDPPRFLLRVKAVLRRRSAEPLRGLA